MTKMKMLKAPALLLIAAMAIGCGAKAAVQTNPTQTQASQARGHADRALREMDFGLTAVDGIRPLLNAVPESAVPAQTKQAIRCSILRGIGLPSQGVSASDAEALTKVCGALPAPGKAALDIAVTELKALSSCVGLATTLKRATEWLSPFISQLDASKDAGLRYAGLALRSGLQFTIMFSAGGVQCS